MKSKSVVVALMLALCQLFPAAQAADPAEKNNAVPKLNITWNCGDCTQNEKVIPLIEQAYSSEAAKHGKVVSESDSADVAIVSYRQRNPGARVMLGFMAGKDTLGLEVKFNDNSFKVSDYSANAMHGMNSLCESVGKKAYDKISGSVK